MTAKPMNKADREKWYAEVVNETNKELAQQDEIIRMAREAGFSVGLDDPIIYAAHKRFAALVAAHEREKLTGELINEAQKEVQRAVLAEREACAKVADGELMNTNMLTSYPPKSSAAWNIAAAIRARGEK